jgi:HSP20 family protein
MWSLLPWKTKEPIQEGPLARSEGFPLSRMRDEFDSLFDRFFGHLPSVFSPEGNWGPGWGLDMNDTGKEVIIRAEAPGFEASDFDVQVSGNWLTIQAQQKQESGARDKKDYCYSERSFQRSVMLPAGTMSEKVNARYRNGILELHLPKSPEAQAKKIEVKS